jgi:hypothetical protein
VQRTIDRYVAHKIAARAFYGPRGPADLMKHPLPQQRPSFREFFHRVDRVAADLNVLLVVVAMGLAMLDFTMFVTQHMIDNLPPVTVVSDNQQAPSSAP